jgi:hypothetical protein
LQKFAKKQAPEEVPLGSSFTSSDKTPSFFQKTKSFFQKKKQEPQEPQESKEAPVPPPEPINTFKKSYAQRIKEKISSTGKLLRQEYNRLSQPGLS